MFLAIFMMKYNLFCIFRMFVGIFLASLFEDFCPTIKYCVLSESISSRGDMHLWLGIPKLPPLTNYLASLIGQDPNHNKHVEKHLVTRIDE